MFLQTMDTIPRKQYIELKVHKGIINRGEMTQKFKLTFNFEVDDSSFGTTLQNVNRNNFTPEGSTTVVTLRFVHIHS